MDGGFSARTSSLKSGPGGASRLLVILYFAGEHIVHKAKFHRLGGRNQIFLHFRTLPTLKPNIPLISVLWHQKIFFWGAVKKCYKII